MGSQVVFSPILTIPSSINASNLPEMKGVDSLVNELVVDSSICSSNGVLSPLVITRIKEALGIAKDLGRSLNSDES